MENWQQVLYSSMRAANNNMLFKTFTAVYYISWIFIGNFILLNLFLAILIDSFNMADAELEDEENLQSEEQIRIQKRRRLESLKNKRLKTLGASMANM